MTIENPIFKVAINESARNELGFSGAAGGNVDLICASPKATVAANDILASLNSFVEIAKGAFIPGIVVAGASAAALGTFSPEAIGLAAVAGGINAAIGNKGGRGQA